jgi:hypothetical protein
MVFRITAFNFAGKIAVKTGRKKMREKDNQQEKILQL